MTRVKIEDEIARLEAERGEIKPAACIACDLASGQRGMDTCGKCQGTGSGFYVASAFYPNTQLGYLHALRDHREVRKPDAEAQS